MNNNWELLNKKVEPENWYEQVGRYQEIHASDLDGPIGSLVINGELSSFPVYIFSPKEVEKRQQEDARKRIANNREAEERINREEKNAALPLSQ